jgi:hypothetical protein
VCCSRTDGVNTTHRQGAFTDNVFLTAPTKFAFVAPKPETVVCDLDEVGSVVLDVYL